MKTNIVTRLIIDSENHKTYLSVEGKVEKANQEEREELRDKLIRAFSEVLGLETTGTIQDAQVLNDFITTNEEPPVSIMETPLEQPVEEQKADEPTTPVEKPAFVTEIPVEKPAVEEKPAEPAPKAEEPILKFGKFKNLTPTEAIAKSGKEAVRYFKEFMLPKALLKEEARNKLIIDAINAAIQLFENGGDAKPAVTDESGKDEADLLIEAIKALSESAEDPELESVDLLCKSIGTTFAAVVAAKDVNTLAKVLEMLKDILREVDAQEQAE